MFAKGEEPVNNLKYLRKLSGLSMRELASYTGVMTSTINYLEKEQRPFRQVHIDRLTSFFDVTVDFLLGRSDVGIYVYPQFGEEKLLFTQEEFNNLRDKITCDVLVRPATISAKFVGKTEDTYIETSHYVYREIVGKASDYETTENLIASITGMLKKMSAEDLEKTKKFIVDYIIK